MTIPLESISHDTVEPFLDHVFKVKVGDAKVDLKLGAVQRLGHKRPEAARDPFSLAFFGTPGLRLPQGIYRFACEGFGEIEWFITQVADGPQGSEFEVIFT
jgi:hypothetical protein